MSKTKTLITSGKRKQIVRLMEDGLDKVDLDDPRAQRIIERGDELQEGLTKLLEELSLTDQFADEEKESSFVYPAGYRVRGVTEQINRLRELFPCLRSANEKLAEQPLPAGVEGFFAIPCWQKLAPTYNGAVELILAKIAKTRRFYNWRAGYLGERYLRQHQRTVKMFEALAAQQPNHDILVVPGQFGLRHRGRSVRRAREVFTVNEIGFGAFAVGIMLLTHPERLVNDDDLWIDCPGDEYAPDAVGSFGEAPYFPFDGVEVEFGARYVGHANARCGAASGFLSQ